MTIDHHAVSNKMTEQDLSNQPIPDVYYTMEEIAMHKGNNELPIWIGVNGK